jgi:hypothetical protein
MILSWDEGRSVELVIQHTLKGLAQRYTVKKVSLWTPLSISPGWNAILKGSKEFPYIQLKKMLFSVVKFTLTSHVTKEK